MNLLNTNKTLRQLLADYLLYFNEYGRIKAKPFQLDWAEKELHHKMAAGESLLAFLYQLPQIISVKKKSENKYIRDYYRESITRIMRKLNVSEEQAIEIRKKRDLKRKKNLE